MLAPLNAGEIEFGCSRALIAALLPIEAFEVSMAGTRNMASPSSKETRSETKLLIARIRHRAEIRGTRTKYGLLEKWTRGFSWDRPRSHGHGWQTRQAECVAPLNSPSESSRYGRSRRSRPGLCGLGDVMDVALSNHLLNVREVGDLASVY